MIPPRHRRRPEHDETTLVALARDGDRRALEELLDLHAPRIAAVCHRLCSDAGDAQDATQEALVAVATRLGTFDGRSALSTWIHRIATNAALDELRRRRRRPLPADTTADASPDAYHARAADVPVGDPAPDEAVEAGELRRRLRRCLDELPEEFRTAVVLRDVADLDYAAVAEILEVPVGTVRSRIARGRARLADALGTETDLPTSDDVETR